MYVELLDYTNRIATILTADTPEGRTAAIRTLVATPPPEFFWARVCAYATEAVRATGEPVVNAHKELRALTDPAEVPATIERLASRAAELQRVVADELQRKGQRRSRS